MIHSILWEVTFVLLNYRNSACLDDLNTHEASQILTTNLLTLTLGRWPTGWVDSWALFSNMARRFRAVSIEGMHSSSSSYLSMFWLYSLLRSTSDSHFSNLARREAAFLALCEDLACVAARKHGSTAAQQHQHSVCVHQSQCSRYYANFTIYNFNLLYILTSMILPAIYT